MGKATTQNWWELWVVPGTQDKVFLENFVSSFAADRYVFGRATHRGARFDFTCFHGILAVTDVENNTTVASRRCPRTFEEAVPWLRMVAEMMNNE